LSRLLKKILMGALTRFYGGERFVTSLGRLFGLILEHRYYMLMALLCMIGYNILAAAPAWYIKNIVDYLGKGQTPPISRFALVGLGIVLIYTLKGAFFFGQSYMMGIVEQKLVLKLRSRLYSHMQSLSFAFFTSRPAGDLISRFTSDMINLQKSLRMAISGPFRDIPQIFLLMGILVARSWELFTLTLILIPIALFLISRFGRRNNKLTSERLSTFGQMTSLISETISGIRVVKAFGMEKYEQERFEKANEELMKKHMRTIAISSYSNPVLETIGAVAGASMIMLGGYLIIVDYITGGDFVSFLFAFFMMNEPVKKLNGFNMVMQEGIASADRVFELLDVEPEVIDKPGAKKLEPIKKQIEIKVNSFCYVGKDRPVLKDISINVKAGDVVALVGSSGSGKTTLVNLIPRFFDMQDGTISIDGTDIQDVTLSSLRAQIAIVTQEIFLFNDTVANNIAYGNINCPREDIESAAKAANAHEFILALPHGYETVIGEGGLTLSGGQRQRLSIARALIKNAPILILDEATSALDSESESEVQVALDNLLANRTTIVIAHRLSTIRRASMIYVMSQGQIVERGRHDDLIDSGGQYKRLYEMQFRDSGHPIPTRSSRGLRRWWSLLTADTSDPIIKSS